MIVLAKPFISIFLGEKWIAAALPMQILVLATGISIFVQTSYSLFNAMGKTKFNFKINCTSLIVMSIFIYPLITNYEVLGVSLCFLIISVAMLIVWKIEISKLLGFSMKDFTFILHPIINTLIVMAAILFLENWVNVYHLGVFVSTIIFGCISYFAGAIIFDRLTSFKLLDELVAIIKILLSQKKNIYRNTNLVK